MPLDTLINHYKWLETNLNTFTSNLGLKGDYRGLIVAHGDKCYGYKYEWDAAGIPFYHGVAIYLISYLKEYDVRLEWERNNTWGNMGQWVIDNYLRFIQHLPE